LEFLLQHHLSHGFTTVNSRMPIENERKFVLFEDGGLEARLAKAPDVARKLLRQAYLDVSGLRIRSIEAEGTIRYIFSYKRPVEGQMVEIETDIAPTDFERLWKLRRETLRKVRYSWDEGRFHWDIDFFKTDDERTYFALAEVEMPEEDTVPPPVPSLLEPYLVDLVPMGDPRFTSKRLADRAHAEQLLVEAQRAGKIM
jgi:CYTH domain-containing protein